MEFKEGETAALGTPPMFRKVVTGCDLSAKNCVHRDDLTHACPAIALGCDAGRQTDCTKRVFN
jgi:hypothetical protein